MLEFGARVSRRYRGCAAVVAAALVLSGCAKQQEGTAAAGIASSTQSPTTATVTTTVTMPEKTVTKTATTTVTSTPSTTAKTSSTTPTGLSVGAGVTGTTDDGEAEILVVSVRRETVGGDKYAEDPKNGTYLIVEVSYSCTDGEFSYNPFDWKVRDAAGHSYDTSYSAGYDDQRLDSGVIAVGSLASGTIAFDVPADALTLEYSLGWSAPATWAVPAA